MLLVSAYTGVGSFGEASRTSRDIARSLHEAAIWHPMVAVYDWCIPWRGSTDWAPARNQAKVQKPVRLGATRSKGKFHHLAEILCCQMET
jgi:hypothetical protein